MSTLAKIEANKRNAALSTGPRTPEGKLVVARNAATHGIFAAVPVLPGESADAWERHRAGVVESLAPVGLLEVNLAERAALLLWRLQRLARYEAETVAAAMEDAEVPPLPPATDFAAPVDHERPTRDGQLNKLRRELRDARRDLEEVTAARDFLSGGADVAPFAVAESVLEAARGQAEAAENLRSDPPALTTKVFLRKLGLPGADPHRVTWTAELIGRGVAVYAGYARRPAAAFAQEVRIGLEEWAEEMTRRVRRLEREADAVARLLDGRAERKRAARLLPGDGRDERIAKYERHLHGLLTSTLHELERLQARRDGAAVPPPAVADLNVTVDVGTS